MSIYATLWSLKFPVHRDDHWDCGWVEVTAQGVPPHIGSPAPSCGFKDGDPFADFLPPPVDGEGEIMRAVVFIKQGTKKGTARNPQEYVDPLFTLTGGEYAKAVFKDLHSRICDALVEKRSSQPWKFSIPPGIPRLLLVGTLPNGTTTTGSQPEGIMWEIIFDEEPKKRMAYFLDKNKDRIKEMEKVLEDLQSYPRAKWLRLYGDHGDARFVSESNRQIRLAGKASFFRKTLVITHFSFHV